MSSWFKTAAASCFRSCSRCATSNKDVYKRQIQTTPTNGLFTGCQAIECFIIRTIKRQCPIIKQRQPFDITIHTFRISKGVLDLSLIHISWDKPEICNKSEKHFGCASINICTTNEVPISGKESVPVLQKICSGVTPRAFGEVNRLITCSSLVVTSLILIPVKSSRCLYMVGTMCPNSSNFRIVSCKEWKSKWVVILSLSDLSAGCCTGAVSYTHLDVYKRQGCLPHGQQQWILAT